MSQPSGYPIQPPITPDQEPIDMSYQPQNDDEFVDYFSGFGGTRKFMLPDKIQYIEFQLLNEGQKAKFQRDTRSNISIDRKTDKANISPDPSKERHALIKSSVCDWNLFSRDKNTGKRINVNYSIFNLENWLKNANPKIVEDLEKAIRKENPWMLEDFTLEDIDEQIKELQEMREEKERQLAEKSNSGETT